MCDELSVGRMVRRLDANDFRFELTVVLVDVFEEVQLRLGRSHEENLTVTLEGARDLAEVPVLVIGVVPDADVDLIGVAMDVRAGGIDERLLDALGVDLEDPGLFMIDPDDCVLHDDSPWTRCGRTATGLGARSRVDSLSNKEATVARGGLPKEREYFASSRPLRAELAGPLWRPRRRGRAFSMIADGSVEARGLHRAWAR